MDEAFKSMDVELICMIMGYGQGSKMIKAAKRCGVTGGTVIMAKGSVTNRILCFIGLSDVRKEIILMVAEKETANRALDRLNKEFELMKPNHGIAFTTSICGVMGTKSITCQNQSQERGADETVYQVITTIVDRGRAEDVIEAANQAGAKGGTIINARGSGIHETSRLFTMDIEPEKEIVIILSETRITQAIVDSIRVRLKIDDPGKGIIYIQNVNKTWGLYK